MKALKEKRVSLRSLFRRSLVILSLLALAFASCSDSGGDTNGGNNGNGNGNGQPPQVILNTVAGMTVLEHPYLPSYEGAYPDLTGLKVLVFWSNGKESSIVDDPSKFVVYPSVAYVTNSGTSETSFSTFNQYGIQFKDDALLNPSALKVNVYIPAVVAINGGNYTSTGASIAGTLGEVYEDKDIDPADLELYADYLADPPKPTDVPADYYSSNWATATWTGAAGVKAKRISPYKDAWRMSQDPTKKEAEYFLRSVPGASIVALPVGIDTFYYVADFELVSGADKIKGVIADDGNFNEFADPSDPNPNDMKTAYLIDPATSPGLIRVGLNWWQKLYDAGLRFKVTYYDPSAPAGTRGPTREIGMAEYTKAMHTTDKDGYPKASLPIATGRLQEDPVPAAAGPDYVSDVITSVIEEYPLSLRLYYYNRLIRGTYGLGYVDLKDADRKYVAGSDDDLYVFPNYAVVPITDSNVIYTFKEIETIERRDNTDNDQERGGAYAVNNGSEADNRQNVYEGLKLFWKINYIYQNEAKGDTLKVEDVVWPAYTARDYVANFANDPRIVDFDNEPTEETVEKDWRPITINLPLPISSRIVDGEAETEAEFAYVMKP